MSVWALAETVVILMRIAAMREMRLSEEVNKPSLADVQEFRGHKMDCSGRVVTPHEEACGVIVLQSGCRLPATTSSWKQTSEW